MRLLCERILRVHRIDRALRERLQSMGPDAGRVLKVWSRGVCVVDPNGRPIYLFGRIPLHVPFGVALDCDENISAALVGLQEGGPLIKRGNRLWLGGTTGPGIALDTGTTVDLRWNEESERPPSRWIPKSIQAVCRVLVSHGNFQGLVGVLVCLKSRYPDIPIDIRLPVNQYVRHVMAPVRTLLEARSEDLPAAFLRVCLDLVGCGPGLTPSGDDFLVGFLAAHQFCNSSLARDARKRKWGRALVKLARKQTTLISGELLACAVDGRFSEVLRQAYPALCDAPAFCSLVTPYNAYLIGVVLLAPTLSWESP